MTENREAWPVRHLFDIRIDALTARQVLSVIDNSIASRSRLLIGVVNAAKLVKMHHDQNLRRAVLGADMILADGMSVVWASRLLFRPLPERVAGIDLMTDMLKLADEKGYRVYCLGATEEVMQKVEDHIHRKVPGAKLVGSRNGYYEADEEAEIAKAIGAARPDMLFVGMTSPKKEKFLSAHATTMNVPVCHGVGGSFDVIAGKVKRAPRLWQRLGMEWLYRVVQEPRRMWRRYLVTNTLFCGMVVREFMAVVGTWRKTHA